MKPRYLWVLTTADNLELPRAVADTALELSKMTGVTVDNIRRAARRNKNIYKSKYRVFKIPVERRDEQ